MIDTAVSLLKAVIRKDYREQHRLALALADDALSNMERQSVTVEDLLYNAIRNEQSRNVKAEDAIEEARR